MEWPTVSAIAGLSVVVLAGLLYLIRGEIAKANIDRQPKNGGTGWSDVAKNTNLIVERQTDIIRDIREMRGRLDQHIDDHNRREP